MQGDTFYYIVSEYFHTDTTTWDKTFKSGNTLQDRANAIQFYNKRLSYLATINADYSLSIFFCCANAETEAWQITGVSAEHDEEMQDIELEMLYLNGHTEAQHISALLHGDSYVL